MSGPKVVRIVTREEVVAACRGLLAQLDDAVEAWETVGRRNGTVTDEEVRAVHRRRDEIREMLVADRLVELQKSAAAQVDFLWVDQQERLAAAAARAAEAASAARRGAAVARAVLDRLADTAVPADLRARLEETAAGRTEDGAAVARALSLLAADAEQGGVTERQRELAARLREPGGRESLAEWMAAQAPQLSADAERLAARIAGFGVFAGEAEATALHDRLRAAEAVQGPRRALLIDSLEADLRVAYDAARRRHELRARLRRLAAELAATEVPELARLAGSLRDRMEADEDALSALEAGAQRALDRHQANAAARARREAVLTGLAALGYQVSEGMQTAWVQDGRVVLRHGTRPGYGVELASPADSERLQVRAVAFRSADAPADPVRDTDAETLWCSDLHDLDKRLAASGGGIHIERALPVGAVPLRVISESTAEAATQINRAPLRELHLK
jgi:hypothetical protein